MPRDRECAAPHRTRATSRFSLCGALDIFGGKWDRYCCSAGRHRRCEGLVMVLKLQTVFSHDLFGRHSVFTIYEAVQDQHELKISPPANAPQQPPRSCESCFSDCDSAAVPHPDRWRPVSAFQAAAGGACPPPHGGYFMTRHPKSHAYHPPSFVFLVALSNIPFAHAYPSLLTHSPTTAPTH
ncbi:hypothetical protein EJ06DRAFT_294491 [Trichodelitschia bisporula]|uniref:Uncharacterized protein n=1 Tax=Trichodelitschia bisporula TaxID=703511 RepID=A0A6G1I6A2_9PEZI|nr:hypothetical protein EJ06DRAFT_294491 [Trichodelitschia bisporula]